MKGDRRQKPRSVSETTSVFGHLGYGWRTQTFIPSGGRKDEQGFLNAREALCLTPAFRRDIQELRKRYPASYWEQGHQADRDVHALCRKWQRPDSESEWILRLVQCWHDGQTEPPRLPIAMFETALAPDQKRIEEDREKLCQTPGFCEDIQSLRARHPATYWAQGRQLDSDAEQLCQRWGIDGVPWIVWLVEHWDPAPNKLPPREPKDRLPALGNWVFTIESVIEVEPWKSDQTIPPPTAKPERPIRATLVFHSPDISLREAYRAVRDVIRALRPEKKDKKMKGGQFPLTDLERADLRAEFEKVGIPSPRGRLVTAHKVQASLKEKGRMLSLSTISKELREWLREKGQPVKRYAH